MIRLRLMFAILILAFAAAIPAHGREDGPALWRLADEDTTVWLFGTVHVLPPDLEWMRGAIIDAFGEADTLYLEVPTDEEAQAGIAELMPMIGVNPAGVTLSSMIGTEDQARLTRVSASLGVPQANLEGLRPWLASVLLSVQAIVSQGQDPESGVERVLEAEAERTGMDVRYFETPEQQLRIFADLAPSEELAFLTETLRQIEEEPDLIGGMDDAWVAGDLAALDEAVNDGLRDTSEDAYEALIVHRNRAWAEEINALMVAEAGVFFIGVGAGHLVGEDSIQSLLEAEGWRIEQR